jgi:hypothetical protein
MSSGFIRDILVQQDYEYQLLVITLVSNRLEQDQQLIKY